MSRAAVYDKIRNSSALQALGFASGEVYSSLAMENTKADKFIVLRWGSETPAFGTVGNEILTVWVYDRLSSYRDINKALKIIRDDLLLPMLHVVGTDGGVVSQVGFNGFSEDLYDDIFKRATRNAVFTINTHQTR